MGIENMFKTAAKVAAGMAADELHRQALGELGLAGGGGVTFEQAAAGLPGFRPTGRGRGQAFIPAGKLRVGVTVSASGSAAFVSHAAEVTYRRSDPPAPLLAVLLRRNHQSGYPSWGTAPDGKSERLVCSAAVPLAGLTAETLLEAAEAVAREAADLAAEMRN